MLMRAYAVILMLRLGFLLQKFILFHHQIEAMG